MGFLELRNLLMSAHGWDRRVATMAARLYRGPDTVADLEAAKASEYGRALLTEGEYRTITSCR